MKENNKMIMIGEAYEEDLCATPGIASMLRSSVTIIRNDVVSEVVLIPEDTMRRAREAADGRRTLFFTDS